MAQVSQGASWRRYWSASFGRTPARTSDDLPEPETPWISTSRLSASRSMTSSIICSRPKKIDHSSLLERTQARIGPRGPRDRDRRGDASSGRRQLAARERASSHARKPAAPVRLVDVETFDAELRDVDRQAFAGLVEDRAGHRRAARGGDAFALVDADVQEIADKALRRQRRAAASAPRSAWPPPACLGLALPVREAFPAPTIGASPA